VTQGSWCRKCLFWFCGFGNWCGRARARGRAPRDRFCARREARGRCGIFALCAKGRGDRFQCLLRPGPAAAWCCPG
jgi:hypothetical protein